MLKPIAMLSLILMILSTSSFNYAQSTTSNQSYESNGAKVYDQVINSIYTIYGMTNVGEPGEAQGSAVAVTEELLATNCHVALSGNYMMVKINKKPQIAGLFYNDPSHDLCLIAVPGAQFKPVNIRPSNQAHIGDEVYAIGNPLGYEGTITTGIISNKEIIDNQPMLQISAAISPGSSGGGLFDKDGHLIGITKSRNPNGENIGFAIPSEALQTILNPQEEHNKEHQQKSENIASNENDNSVIDTTTPANNDDQSSKLIKINSFSNNHIALYRFQDICFITIMGHDKNLKIKSIAIWLPAAPEKIFTFPHTTNIVTAINLLNEFLDKSNTDLSSSNSYLVLDDKLYPLLKHGSNNNADSVLITIFKKNITERLLVDDVFFIQFYQYYSDSSMTTMWYDLDGVTEALAAYDSSCEKN